MTDSNKKPAPAAPGKPAGRPTGHAGRPGAPSRKQGPGKTGLRAAAKAKAKAKAKGQVVTPAHKPATPMTPGKRALAWTHTARFLTTASQLKHLPVNGVLPADALAAEEAEALAHDFDDELDFGVADAAGVDGAADQVEDDEIDGEVDGSTDGVIADDQSGAESAAQDLPPRQLPEIAFVGRSNAGKSTAINMLAQQKRLAFASKTPGRTQHINLFSLGPRDAPDALFADLPGYGYAAVARDAKLRWQRVMADYLGKRDSLSGVVLMVDSRLGLTELDKQLLEFVSDRITGGEISLLVLLTKADKLNRKEGTAVLAQVQKDLEVLATEDSNIAVTLFSALSKQGLEDVAEVLYDWAHPVMEEAGDAGDEAGDDAADLEDEHTS